MRRSLLFFVVFTVLFFGVTNTTSAMTITDVPAVVADLNLNIDSEISSLANPVLDFFADVLGSSNQLEPMAKKNKKWKNNRGRRRHGTAPEPATWLLIGSGAAGLALLRKKFKK